MNNYNLIFCLIVVFTVYACNTSKDNSPATSEQVDSLQADTRDHEIVIADPIVYDVIIQNLDKEDPWKEESIKNLDRQLMINHYFQAVYNGDVEAYDLFTNEKMDGNDLKEFENAVEFDRSKVGKIQFYEQWYLDTITNDLRKDVTEMVFGYHKLTADSQLVGYTPVFRIALQP